MSEAVLLQATQGRCVSGAGGARSLAEDRATLVNLPDGDTPIVVVCKAWEPPLLELQDFLGEPVLDGRQVEVMPIAVQFGRPVPAARRDREVWGRAFAASPHRLVSPLGVHP